MEGFMILTNKWRLTQYKWRDVPFKWNEQFIVVDVTNIRTPINVQTNGVISNMYNKETTSKAMV